MELPEGSVSGWSRVSLLLRDPAFSYGDAIVLGLMMLEFRPARMVVRAVGGDVGVKSWSGEGASGQTPSAPANRKILPRS